MDDDEGRSSQKAIWEHEKGICTKDSSKLVWKWRVGATAQRLLIYYKVHWAAQSMGLGWCCVVAVAAWLDKCSVGVGKLVCMRLCAFELSPDKVWHHVLMSLCQATNWGYEPEHLGITRLPVIQSVSRRKGQLWTIILISSFRLLFLCLGACLANYCAKVVQHSFFSPAAARPI